MPGAEIVGEESFDAKNPPVAKERFFLVDPLDGTREFISGRAEFTVNIAYVEEGLPVAGCVFAPAAGRAATVPVTSSRSTALASGAVGAGSPPELNIQPMPMPKTSAAAAAAANPVIRCIDCRPL